MTKCPLERPPAYLASLGEDASRHGQLPVRGKQVFDRLFMLLSTHLHPKPRSASYTSPLSPALLSSICDALRHACIDGPNKRNDASILPSVLSKLRDWRLVDPEYRYSASGLRRLALDLAGIVDKPTASISSDRHRISHARRRMKWVRSDSPSENQLLPCRFGVVGMVRECTDALPSLDESHFDAPFQVGFRLGTPDSEGGHTVASRRLHSVSGFRNGCSACRQPRMSIPSTPASPQRMTLEQRTPFSQVNQLETTVRASRYPPSTTVQRTPTEKRRRAKDKMSRSVSRDVVRVDENEWPVARPTEARQAISASFPRQRTPHPHPHISNSLLSWDPTASVEQRVGPRSLRTCDEQQTSWSLQAVAPVDPTGHSLIDLSQTSAQRFSYSPAHSHGLGSISVSVQKLSSNTAGSWNKRLPSWTPTHPTTSTSCGKPTQSSPAEANIQKSLLSWSRPSIAFKV